MALTYDLGKITDSESLYVQAGENAEGKQSYRLDGVCETIIFATMMVGIGEITEDNAAEFFARLTLLDTVIGPLAQTPTAAYVFTPKDVRRLIGLKTNVYPEKSRAVFVRDLKPHLVSALERGARSYSQDSGAASAGDMEGNDHGDDD